MSEAVNQDETSDFVCESEDTIVVEAKSQEVDRKEEPASSKGDNAEDKASEEVEAKADTKTDSTDNDDDSTGTNTAAEDDKANKPNGVQKRIDKVVREREDAKRENEALTKRIKELEGNKPDKDKDQAKEPVESDFETYDKYLDALDEFDKQPDRKAVKEPATDKKDTESQDEAELTASQKTALAVTLERVSAAAKPADFEAVAFNPDIPVTGEMLEALSECDDPAKVLYHLGQNKDLAAEIAGKTAVQQARAIAMLDLTVTGKPNKPTKITNAPDVIDPVGGSDSQKKAHSEMSFSEFEAEDRARNSKRKSTW
jgi:hypothetical protein